MERKGSVRSGHISGVHFPNNSTLEGYVLHICVPTLPLTNFLGEKIAKPLGFANSHILSPLFISIFSPFTTLPHRRAFVRDRLSVSEDGLTKSMMKLIINRINQNQTPTLHLASQKEEEERI